MVLAACDYVMNFAAIMENYKSASSFETKIPSNYLKNQNSEVDFKGYI